MHNTGRFSVYMVFFSLLYRKANSLSLYNNTYVYMTGRVSITSVYRNDEPMYRERYAHFPQAAGKPVSFVFFSLKLCTKQKLLVDFNLTTNNVRERSSRTIYKSSVRIGNVRCSINENKSNTLKTSINIEHTPKSLTFSFPNGSWIITNT